MYMPNSPLASVESIEGKDARSDFTPLVQGSIEGPSEPRVDRDPARQDEWVPARPQPIAVASGVVALAGYGLSVRVERGELELRDGIGRNRRAGRLSRATSGLARLVVLGHTGAITFDAIRWLHDVGAGYVQIDADGTVLAAFGPLGADKPALRRAQARALDGPVGLVTALDLVARKLQGQRRTVELLGTDPCLRAEATRAIDI
jgi:hypothetical protein